MQEVHIILAGLMLLAGCSTLNERTSGEIQGRVLSHDGTPLVDAKVAVNAPQYYGRHPTNSKGMYRLRDVPLGRWTVEFHCPSANYVGRRIAQRSADVRGNAITHIDIQVPNGYCDEPPYSELASTFTGFVSYGFEHSEFTPCHSESLNLSKNLFFDRAYIWVALKRDQLEKLKPNATYFVRVKGTLKGPGQYGHMGVSLYQLEIQSFDQLEEVADKECSKYDASAK